MLQLPKAKEVRRAIDAYRATNPSHYSELEGSYKCGFYYNDFVILVPAYNEISWTPLCDASCQEEIVLIERGWKWFRYLAYFKHINAAIYDDNEFGFIAVCEKYFPSDGVDINYTNFWDKIGDTWENIIEQFCERFVDSATEEWTIDASADNILTDKTGNLILIDAINVHRKEQ